MLRRDFETFFLGTAMTISRTGAALLHAPQKSCGRAYRRGRRLSLAKTSRRRNILAAAARLVPERRQAGKGMAALFGGGLAGTLARLRQHILEADTGPARIGIDGQGQLFGNDFTDVEHVPRQRLRRIRLRA